MLPTGEFVLLTEPQRHPRRNLRIPYLAPPGCVQFVPEPEMRIRLCLLNFVGKSWLPSVAPLTTIASPVETNR